MTRYWFFFAAFIVLCAGVSTYLSLQIRQESKHYEIFRTDFSEGKR